MIRTAAILTLAATAAASAQAVSLSDLATFTASQPAVILEDFESFTDGDILGFDGSPIDFNGFTLQRTGEPGFDTDVQIGATPNGSLGLDIFLDNNFLDEVTISFDQAINAFGFQVFSPASANGFSATVDGSILTISATSPGGIIPSGENFLVFQSSTAFDTVVFQTSGLELFTIDNFATGIPSPASAGSLALAGLAAARRRRG